MKFKEIKPKSEKELQQLLQEKREHLRQHLFDLAGKKLKNVRQIRETRQDIARILTLLSMAQTVKKQDLRPSPSLTDKARV